jgi:hypothetical protein
MNDYCWNAKQVVDGTFFLVCLDVWMFCFVHSVKRYSSKKKRFYCLIKPTCFLQ